MRISIFDGRLPTSAALHSRVRQRLQRSFRSVGDRLGLIEVRFVDVNGTKGGEDKRCRILAHINSGGSIAVAATRDDYYAAFGDAVSRIKSAVRRRVERQKK